MDSRMLADISIIITTYNVERYIEKAIESALSQSGVNCEIIIVDDCSTDSTWDILSKIQNHTIKCFSLKENGGPSVARNEAIKHCTGEWIAILDGDDRFEKDRLAQCLSTAKNNNADLVIDNLTIYEEETGDTHPMFDPEAFTANNTLTLDHYIKGNLFGQKSHTLGYTKPIFKREFITKNNINYNPDIRIGEDYLFMAEMLALGGICAIEKTAGYIYTVRGSSISHRLKPKDVQIIIDTDTAFLKKFSLDTAAQKAQNKRTKSLKDIHAFTLLVEAIKHKNIKGIIQSLILSPTAPRHLSDAICNRFKRSK